jgi:hypothetical protein
VPYWDNILHAKANLGHVTASVTAHEYVAPTEEAIRGHIPSYGFADGKVTYPAPLHMYLMHRGQQTVS